MNNIQGKIFKGVVVSAKMQGTVAVKVVHAFAHPLYRKTTNRMRVYLADTAGKTIAEGENVSIQETKPMSRKKHFVVIADKK